MSDAAEMLVAQLNGGTYPPEGTEDTPENRQLWDQIAAEVKDMEAKGIIPDVPWEYAKDVAGAKDKGGKP